MGGVEIYFVAASAHQRAKRRLCQRPQARQRENCGSRHDGAEHNARDGQADDGRSQLTYNTAKQARNRENQAIKQQNF